MIKFGELLAYELSYTKTYWKITPPRKTGVGQDFNDKTDYLYWQCVQQMTPEQAQLVQGLADHESAGTWDPKIKGDNGHSTGIGQWYAPAGRKAPKTFKEQAKKLCDEMAYKFSVYSDPLAITAHNRPASARRGQVLPYYYKVLKASKQFN